MGKESQTFDLQLFAEEEDEKDKEADQKTAEGEPSASEGEPSEEKDVKQIPYDRFKEVNDKKKEAEARLAEAEERNRQLEEHFLSLQKNKEEPEEEDEIVDWEKPKTAIRNILREELKKELPTIIAVETRKQKTIDEARTLFPDLDDSDSPFFKATARTIRQLGLSSHPEGIKIAASVVATSEMPEVFNKMRTTNEEARRSKERFVEGDKFRRDESSSEEFVPEQKRLLQAMGLKDKEIQSLANDFASRGGR